jgi:hypothetical protein
MYYCWVTLCLMPKCRTAYILSTATLSTWRINDMSNGQHNIRIVNMSNGQHNIRIVNMSNGQHNIRIVNMSNGRHNIRIVNMSNGRHNIRIVNISNGRHNIRIVNMSNGRHNSRSTDENVYTDLSKQNPCAYVTMSCWLFLNACRVNTIYDVAWLRVYLLNQK